jgi:hypothetical protein
MEDVNISKYRAQVVRAGSTPASPGFVVSEGQNPVDPSGSGQNHLPVTIATAATGLSITESQVLGGAGTVGQYIRGDGSLADFPATTGGGSSVSYYLNGSVSQGTIGGVAYKELNRMPVFGAGTDISINADGYIASFITDALDPNKLLIPGGNWNFETYFSASSSGGSPSFYVELYKYDGTTFTLLATSSSAPELIAFGTNLNPYFSTLAVPETVLALTDRLAVRFYVTHSGRTITLHTEDNHLCQVITTFTTGLTALNGLTSQVQFFAVGTSGTDFAISSASDTHTFNLPTATSTIRGALSSADWSTFNGKQNALTLTTTGTSGAATLVGSTLNIPQYQAAGTYVTAVTASSPLFSSGGTTPNITIQQASGSQNGFLSSTDWTTFNSKQNALTNPVTGTGTSGTLPKFTGSTTIGNSLFSDNGTHGAFGGGNYSTGTDVRSFNISSPLYSTLAFWANNVYTGDIFSYGFTGNLFINADPTNVFANTKIALSIDGTERLGIFSNGNVTIANSPTDAGFKLDVNGTGRFSGILYANSNIVIGSATNTNELNIYATTSPTIKFQNSGADRGKISANSNAFVYNSLTGNGHNFQIDGVDKFTLAALTGAATFSSSVTASSLALSGTIANSGDAATLTIKQASTTFTNGIYLERAGERNGYYMYIGGGLDALTFRRNYFGTQSDVLSLNRDGTAAFTDSVTSKVNNISADGAGVVLQGYVDNTLRIAVRGSGYNSGARGGLFASFGNFSSSVTSNIALSLEAAGQNGISDGPYFRYLNTTNSYQILKQINASTDEDTWSIRGGSWVKIGTLNATTGVYTPLSDKNKKKDFEQSTIGLNAILGLKPTLYRMKDQEETEQKQLGFIAQEVKEYIPQACIEHENFIGLQDRPIIAALVKAIQELKQEIDTLKN